MLLYLFSAFAAASSPAEPLTAQWIFPPDYPPSLVREGKEGTVEFELTFNRQGRVTGCVIQKSSGTALLDAHTCRLSLRRGRAMNGEASALFRHIWKLPTSI